MKHIEVAAGIIIRGGKIFGAKRGNRGETAGKWEFPGGKIEPGERPEQTAVREIREEIGAEVTADSFFMTVRHTYTTFELTMHTYLCSVASGSFTLAEHTDSRWFFPGELGTVEWAPADAPIIEKLQKFFSGT